MARLVYLLKSDLGKGIAIGLSVGAIGAAVAPLLRPMAKDTIKFGMLLTEKGRQWISETYDSLDEMVTGVRTSVIKRSSD